MRKFFKDIIKSPFKYANKFMSYAYLIISIFVFGITLAVFAITILFIVICVVGAPFALIFG